MTAAPGLVVSELFGPTIQGEGRYAGRRAVFLRTGRCNLDCTWCDTPYTWDWTRYKAAEELTTHDCHVLHAHLRLLAGDHPAMLIVTGGEPLLQHDGLRFLVEVRDLDVFPTVQVETNGTRPPLMVPRDVRYTLSPKLETSGVDARKRRVHDAWDRKTGVDWKFVLTGAPGELDEIGRMVDTYHVRPDHVWLMAEGTGAAGQASNMRPTIQRALDHGYNYSPRLHVLAWGDRRGV